MSNLINVIPETDPSGFEDIFVNSGLDDNYIYNRLVNLITNHNTFNHNNKEILEAILTSYEDFIKKKKKRKKRLFCFR